jgi:hypothetical protein
MFRRVPAQTGFYLLGGVVFAGLLYLTIWGIFRFFFARGPTQFISTFLFWCRHRDGYGPDAAAQGGGGRAQSGHAAAVTDA